MALNYGPSFELWTMPQVLNRIEGLEPFLRGKIEYIYIPDLRFYKTESPTTEL